jgi:inhibitor of KinA
MLLSNNDVSYKIFPLGDSAITIDYGNVIDEFINKKVIALFDLFSKKPVPGMIEAVPAYSSITIFYDPVTIRKTFTEKQTAFEWISGQIELRLKEDVLIPDTTSRLIKIPVCYDPEFGLDIKELAFQKNLSPAEVVEIHTAKTYRVYMLGFVPGFTYMGQVDDRITIPRKSYPRLHVEAGSVGIAGKQTGIYPLQSPGGWQLIGRTPIRLFNMNDDPPALLRAGDTVEFIAIGKDEFSRLQ